MTPKNTALSDAQREVLEELEFLMERAKRGDLVGLAYVVLDTGAGREVLFNTAGDLRTNALFASGCVLALLRSVQDKVSSS